MHAGHEIGVPFGDRADEPRPSGFEGVDLESDQAGKPRRESLGLPEMEYLLAGPALDIVRIEAHSAASGGSGSRNWTMRKRWATKARSARQALPAGFSPVT